MRIITRGKEGMTRLKTIYAYDPLEIEWDGTEVLEAVCLKCGRYCTQLVSDGVVHYKFCPWCGEEVKTDGLNQ